MTFRLLVNRLYAPSMFEGLAALDTESYYRLDGHNALTCLYSTVPPKEVNVQILRGNDFSVPLFVPEEFIDELVDAAPSGCFYVRGIQRRARLIPLFNGDNFYCEGTITAGVRKYAFTLDQQDIFNPMTIIKRTD